MKFEVLTAVKKGIALVGFNAEDRNIMLQPSRATQKTANECSYLQENKKLFGRLCLGRYPFFHDNTETSTRKRGQSASFTQHGSPYNFTTNAHK